MVRLHRRRSSAPRTSTSKSSRRPGAAAVSLLFVLMLGCEQSASENPSLIPAVQLEAGAAFSFHQARGGFFATNAVRSFDLRLQGDTMEVEHDDVRVALELVRSGRSGNLAAVDRVAVEHDANRVALAHSSIAEWYINGPLGLEQGFTLESPPSGEQLLELEVRVEGLVPVRVGTDIELQDDEGRARLFYGGLRAADENGRSLAAALDAYEDRIIIRVDDEGASYPITIDPFVLSESQVLSASDAAALDEFGGTPTLTAGGPAVAIDGDAALIAATYDDGRRGAVYVFERSAGTWSETQKLEVPSADANARFGYSIALEGDVAVIGAPLPLSVNGSAFVFTRTAGTWSLAETLGGTNVGDTFGSAVAMDGDVIAIGAREANYVRLYRRSGATWMVEDEVTPAGIASRDDFGSSVAVEGDTLVAGAIFGNAGTGAAYVFTHAAGSWSERSTLLASDAAPLSLFSRSLSIASGRIAIGAPQNEVTLFNQGTAYIFNGSGATWTQSQRLLAPDAAMRDEFAYALALQSDALIVGARFADEAGAAGAGRVYAYRSEADEFVDPASYARSGAAAGDRFGDSVAIDGTTFVVGAPFASGQEGRALILELCDGCRIGDTCVSDGALDPANPCAACRVTLSTNSYSALADGTDCDDGAFCTVGDTCNAGTCSGSARDCSDALGCTDERCDETMDRCEITVSSGCLIAGACIARDADDPTSPCRACLPETSMSAYSERPDGTRCGDPMCSGSTITTAPTCGAGICSDGSSSACPGGAFCEDAMSCASGCGDDTFCAMGFYCDEGTCELELDGGETCTRDAECGSDACVDGVCCGGPCADTCEACNLPGSVGTCTPIPSGEDPSDECALSCDGSGACMMMDAGISDGGISDASVSDGGVSDAGAEDAATSDAAVDDAGLDASFDGGSDAGFGEDAAAVDQSVDSDGGGVAGGGCAAASSSESAGFLLILVAFITRRRRSAPYSGHRLG